MIRIPVQMVLLCFALFLSCTNPTTPQSVYHSSEATTKHDYVLTITTVLPTVSKIELFYDGFELFNLTQFLINGQEIFKPIVSTAGISWHSPIATSPSYGLPLPFSFKVITHADTLADTVTNPIFEYPLKCNNIPLSKTALVDSIPKANSYTFSGINDTYFVCIGKEFEFSTTSGTGIGQTIHDSTATFTFTVTPALQTAERIRVYYSFTTNLKKISVPKYTSDSTNVYFFGEYGLLKTIILK